MATLTIQGRKVTVDDRFLSLSPEDQERTVDEIAAELRVKPAVSGPWDKYRQRGAQDRWWEAAPLVQNGQSDADAWWKNDPIVERQPQVIEVEAPNGDIIEFPAGTPDETIKRVMRRTYGGPTTTGATEAPSRRGTMLDTFVGQGLLLGAGDEMRAGVRGAVRAALDRNLDLGEAYSQELVSSRANLEGYRARHPVLAPVTEVGGAVAGALATGGAGLGARAATTAGRIGYGALEGAGLGTLYGFNSGEGGVENRLEGAADGFVAGGALGAAAPAAIDAGIAAGRALAPVVGYARPFRGALNPEREAARRVAGALVQDTGSAAAAGTRMAELENMRAAGTPAVIGDMGGETTRGLARSAANQSPVAREALQGATDPRYAAQTERATEFLHGLVGGDVNSVARREQLQQAARRTNRPAYIRAYREAPALWTAELQQLASAPAVMAGAGER